MLKARGLVGLSVAVVEDGKTVLAEGFGVRSVATGEPVAPDTMFAVGSITKQFTAACILLLAEDGKLAVTDKVAKWYPGLTRASEITLLDLMNHVSGYPDYYPLDFVDRPMAQGHRQRRGHPPLRDAAARLRAGLALFLLEHRLPHPGPDRREGRRRTVRGFPGPADPPAARPGPYRVRARSARPGLRPRAHVLLARRAGDRAPGGPGWVAAAGALFSTPTDLAAWDLALVDGKVLKPESFKLMTSPRRLTDGTLSNYGCGLAMGERGGVAFLSHSGAVNGFHALNIVVPSTRSSATLFSNLSSYSDTNAVYGELTALVLPKPAAPRTGIPADRRSARRGAGRRVLQGPPTGEGWTVPSSARSSPTSWRTGSSRAPRPA